MIYLSDDDNGVIPRVDLNRDNQIIISQLDPGFPAIREVTDPYVDASGVIDSTVYHDARRVSLRGMIVDGALPRHQVLNRIMAHMIPSARSYLHWQLNDETSADARCVRFRAGNVSRPVQAHNRIYFNLSLIAAKGVIESSELITKTINPSTAGGTESGRAYDLTFDRTYPASDPIGSANIENLGSVTAWPIIKIFGECTNPVIDNVTTGQSFEFPSLSVAAGEVITIDTVNRTILNQSDQSRMPDLDLTTSEWWGLQSGVNILAFQPTTSTAASKCTVQYRHAYI